VTRGNEARPFAGFPGGKTRTVPIPEAFFTELLPRIDHPGELRVTLVCFYHMARRSGPLRYARRSELEADPAPDRRPPRPRDPRGPEPGGRPGHPAACADRGGWADG
jgi:hypothetical protein